MLSAAVISVASKKPAMTFEVWDCQYWYSLVTERGVCVEGKGRFESQSKLHIHSAFHFLSQASSGGRTGTEQM